MLTTPIVLVLLTIYNFVYSLDLNYSLVESRCAKQKSELESLEQKYSNLSEKRRTCEAEMNMLKPDLWKLELKREKYML